MLISYPTLDILEFRKMFPEKRYKSMESGLLKMESDFTNQTPEYDIYEIVEYTDDRGYSKIAVCYVRAISKLHARIKGAIFKNDVEVATTGYYDAYLVKDINSIITKLENHLISTTKKLENAKNPY